MTTAKSVCSTPLAFGTFGLRCGTNLRLMLLPSEWKCARALPGAGVRNFIHLLSAVVKSRSSCSSLPDVRHEISVSGRSIFSSAASESMAMWTTREFFFVPNLIGYMRLVSKRTRAIRSPNTALREQPTLYE